MAPQAGLPQPPPAPPAPGIPALPAQPGATVGGGAGGGAGGNAFTVQPPPGFTPDAIAGAIIPIVGMTLGIILAMGVLWPIARAIGRMIDRRTDKSLMKIAEVAPQLRQLQDSVDAMAIELERISEAQRFTAKLMADRPGALLGEKRS